MMIMRCVAPRPRTKQKERNTLLILYLYLVIRRMCMQRVSERNPPLFLLLRPQNSIAFLFPFFFKYRYKTWHAASSTMSILYA